MADFKDKGECQRSGHKTEKYEQLMACNSTMQERIKEISGTADMISCIQEEIEDRQEDMIMSLHDMQDKIDAIYNFLQKYVK
ncbi:MAG: hypothetical protein LUD51_03780 [Clostridia bacterium]|nr:hypothetical protein [Clostridia bacterium]